MTSLVLQAALGLPLSAPRPLGASQPCVNRRAALSTLPAAALAFRALPSSAATPLSAKEISVKLRPIPVCGVFVNGDQPIFTDSDGQTPVGYFYLESADALPAFKQAQANDQGVGFGVVSLADVYDIVGDKSIGGEMRVRPSRKAVVLANRILLPLGKSVLDEKKGQVPLFYSERVAYDTAGGDQVFPFFLSKDDLDAAYDELQKVTGGPKSEEGGIPIGLVRVATLDGLVDQMLSGEVDLSKAVIVASKASTIMSASASPITSGGTTLMTQLDFDVDCTRIR